MKKTHQFFKVFIFVQLGACFGRILAKYIDYVKHPKVYEMQSAPWYTSIVITVILTIITVTITTIAYFIVGYFSKKRHNNQNK